MRVAILANHPDDPRESMHRFARLLHDELNARGCEAVLLRPGRLPKWFAGFSRRWRNRFEKLNFEWRLRGNATRDFDLIHVADQGNAFYAHLVRRGGKPVVVTCHDLSVLDDAPAAGTMLQRAFHRHLSRRIERGLRAARMVVCDSSFTQEVLQRLICVEAGRARVIHLGPQHEYRRLDRAECAQRLADRRLLVAPFLLHVGANYPRKNRALLIDAFALLQSHAALHLVFAGEPPSAALLEKADAFGGRERIITVAQPSDAVLEALYSTAFAFCFPSTYEGFGWPIIEAQSCGCPVISSDATCLPEIGGEAALYHRPDDAAELARRVTSLFEPAARASLVECGTMNAARFSIPKMMTEYLETYAAITSAA